MMNSTIRKVTFLVLAFVILNKAAAQKTVFTTNSGISIGFGLGAAYQQSDIANSRGGGFDFSLGSYLYKKENALLSVDWKFRFLAGEDRAYDHRINTDDTFSNISYVFFNYDLELGLTLNRLRERTRILVSGFGGFGITHGITSADLLDADGNPYDYTGIDPTLGRKQVYADLVNLSDKKFETKLTGKAAIKPTIGINLGYQFTRSFSLVIEHKINFSLTEYNSLTGIDIDNKIMTGSKRDRNHYTSLGFRWILGGGASRPVYRNTGIVVNTPITTNNYNTVTTTDQNRVIPVPSPVVEIISPAGSTYSTYAGSLEISARVKNVRGKQDIHVVLNGKDIAFEYNSLYGNVSSGLALTEGKNILVITGSNEAGSSRDDLIINRNKSAEAAPPGVRFIDPPSPVTVEKNIFSIIAQTRNVKAWQDVTVTVNGTSISNFNFSPEGRVTTNIPLKEGENKVEVRVRNDSGNASDLMTITYTKPEKTVRETMPCPPPVLKLMEPAQNELLTDNPSCNIRTGISNIGRDQISITLNDRIITNYNFTGNEINFSASLKEGMNSCIIAAANNCGAQKITYSILFKPAEVVIDKPCPKPGINFSISAISREDATHELKGTVSNVRNRSDIFVTVNDKPYETFTFVPGTGVITAAFRLDPGSYTVKAAVRNDCGQDEYSRVINIDEQKPCGIRINPGNSSWEFCLITQSDTLTREALTNNSFRYSGRARSLYFMPIAGGGDAVVKGKPFTIRPGQYYLFTGNLTVTVSTKNPGSMGQWSVCIIADREPVSGNGGNRPQSPCEGEGGDRKPKRDSGQKGK